MNRNIVTVTGQTFDEALYKAKKLYGEKIQILSQKEIEQGGFLGFGSKRIVEIEVFLKPINQQKPIENKDNFLESAARIILQQTKKDVESNKLLKSVLSELDSIKVRLHDMNSIQEIQQQSFETTHPSLVRIQNILNNDNDFPFHSTQTLINEIKKDLSLSELENFSLIEEIVLKEIAKRLLFYTEISRGKPRIIVIVGPTGVGKTTSLAKIAAINVFQSKNKLDVRFINLDSFRIGAKEQLKTYGEILNVPVTTIYESGELKKAINLARDADLILVDTIGKSPYDTIKIAEMQKSVEILGHGTTVHLAVSATIKESDMLEVFSKFELFRYHAVILTKVDETVRLGAALAALMKARKPLSYLTIGQEVPKDIESANIQSIWRRLVGFSQKTLDKVIKQEIENKVVY